MQQEGRGGEVGAGDFRNVLCGAANEIFQGVEAEGASRSGAPGSSGALIGGGLADARNGERGKTGPGGVAGDTREAAIDDDVDAFDGDGAFGDIGGEDQLAAIRRADGTVLFVGRLVAVEGQQE